MTAGDDAAGRPDQGAAAAPPAAGAEAAEPSDPAEAATLAGLFERVCARADLTRDEAERVFRAIVRGALGPVHLAAWLAALRTKGEAPAEVAGAAAALRAAAVPFPRPAGLVADSCGTGGDGRHTVNVSTATALVVAAAGVPVAKHGNRSVSSRCGSADVLEALGVRLDASPEVARACLDEAGACFLFAPRYHPGLRHVMPVRRALRTRTVFNLLGPLVSPARPSAQVLGVYDPALVVPVAEALALLGVASALVVHGAGLDELAVHGETTAARLSSGRVEALTLAPEDAGVARHPADALAGGDPAENARWLEGALAGRAPAAHLDAVALNAGALLWVAGRAPDLRAGVAAARELLARGAPLERPRALAARSQAGA